MNDSTLIYYIASWNWHILAIVLLCSSFIVFFSGSQLGNTVLFIVFLAGFMYCEYMALKRRATFQIDEVLG